AALVKAVLLNSARDIAPRGPDFFSGFGGLTTHKAIETVYNNHYYTNTIAQGELQTIPLTVPANVRQLKITLCWTDPAAPPNAAKALVNDLDLSLLNSITNEEWLPWVLNTMPVKDSLLLPAQRKKDTLNNTEQITIDNPAAGMYSIRVNG